MAPATAVPCSLAAAAAAAIEISTVTMHSEQAEAEEPANSNAGAQHQTQLQLEQHGQHSGMQQWQGLDELPAENLKLLGGHVPPEYTHCR